MIKHAEPQTLTFFADADLACSESALQLLKPMVDCYVEVLHNVVSPSSVEAFARRQQEVIEYLDNFAFLEMDNFGNAGTCYVLDQLDIRWPCSVFVQWGMKHLSEHALTTRRHGAAARHEEIIPRRVLSVAEYYFTCPGAGQPLSGVLVHENGIGSYRGGCRWLRPAELPTRRLVDRALCSEFNLFSDLLRIMEAALMLRQPAVRRQLQGRVRMVVYNNPCVSCICVMRQFKALFPAVQLEVAHGLPLVQSA